MMSPTKISSVVVNLLDDLESALSHGSVARRVDTLRRVTDLFLANNTVDYSIEQLTLFDDVFQCLVRHIEASAMVLLAERLAPTALAPPQIIRQLALHDEGAVAAPVLSRYAQLDDDTLTLAASDKSQTHLLAIATRETVSETIADILIARGNDDVVHQLVSNPGAGLSESGCDRLIERAENDDDLATCLGLRPTIPRHLYLRLVAKASASVQRRLEAANPGQRSDVDTALGEAVRRTRNLPSAMARETAIAHDLVRLLFQDGRLDERQVRSFAEAGKFDETTAAIACLSHTSVATAEALMLDAQTEGVLILAKAADQPWSVARSIIMMRDQLSSTTTPNIESLQSAYDRLRPSTAQQVLRFHHMQRNAAASPGPS